MGKNIICIHEGEKNTLEGTPDIIGKTITVHWLCECGSWKKDTFKVLTKEEDLDVDFENKFSQLIASQDKQKELGRNIKKLALINATKEIVDEVEKLLKR